MAEGREWREGDAVREKASGLVGRVTRIDDDGERIWLDIRWYPSTVSTDDMEPYEYVENEELV